MARKSIDIKITSGSVSILSNNTYRPGFHEVRASGTIKIGDNPKYIFDYDNLNDGFQIIGECDIKTSSEYNSNYNIINKKIEELTRKFVAKRKRYRMRTH